MIFAPASPSALRHLQTEAARAAGDERGLAGEIEQLFEQGWSWLGFLRVRHFSFAIRERTQISNDTGGDCSEGAGCGHAPTERRIAALHRQTERHEKRCRA